MKYVGYLDTGVHKLYCNAPSQVTKEGHQHNTKEEALECVRDRRERVRPQIDAALTALGLDPTEPGTPPFGVEEVAEG